MQVEAKNVLDTIKTKKMEIREKGETKTRQTELVLLLEKGSNHKVTATGKVAFVRVYNSDKAAKPVYDIFALTDEGLKVPVSVDDCKAIVKGKTLEVTLKFSPLAADAEESLVKNAVDYDSQRGFILFDSVTIA